MYWLFYHTKANNFRSLAMDEGKEALLHDSNRTCKHRSLWAFEQVTDAVFLVRRFSILQIHPCITKKQFCIFFVKVWVLFWFYIYFSITEIIKCRKESVGIHTVHARKGVKCPLLLLSFLSAVFAFAYLCWSCREANIFLSRLSAISCLCCSKTHFEMNPFVKAPYKYICLDLRSRNVTNATKANEPILCQLKCHSENLSYHESSVSWGEITDQKWKCHFGISSQLTGPSCTSAQGVSTLNIFWKILCILR